MKNFRTFYEKNDEESYEEWAEREPKERRTKKFRKYREIDYASGIDRYNEKFIPKQ